MIGNERERDVERLVQQLAGRSGSHLQRAVAASHLADLATRISRANVMSAREAGVTWADIAEAFGVATQTAHERFRSGPDGLHSRFAERR
jgi:hypothetical protein